jgi:hypothetical protein
MHEIPIETNLVGRAMGGHKRRFVTGHEQRYDARSGCVGETPKTLENGHGKSRKNATDTSYSGGLPKKARLLCRNILWLRGFQVEKWRELTTDTANICQ